MAPAREMRERSVMKNKRFFVPRAVFFATQKGNTRCFLSDLTCLYEKFFGYLSFLFHRKKQITKEYIN